VQNYAKQETPAEKIKKLMDMGFAEEVCKDALERYDYNPELALNFLLGL